MKTSLAWLQDHLDLSDYDPAALDELLTFSGIEVEGIEYAGTSSESVVIGQVLKADPHPDADKLTVCRVDSGQGEDASHQIVCGAKNFKVGDKIPLALPGAVLPGDFKIKPTKMRGVESGGMMCSGKELGIGDDHAGLLILPEDAPLGKPISTLFPPDVVFDLEITPNRPDCLSHLGVARELAALTKRPLKSGQPSHQKSSTPIDDNVDGDQITISDEVACPMYSGRKVSGIKVSESPEWLKTKLQSIGLRPINNIVDITNYVLFEMGQPLHAFDSAKVSGGIHVRKAAKGEKFLALDEETYSLEEEDLVIADQEKALAIAGVMGGLESGVTEGTTDIILESAYFHPPGIRRTSRRLNLSSDSSYRFERGVDPEQVAGASDLAIKLILELAGGTAEDTLGVCGSAPNLTTPVELDYKRARQVMSNSLDDGGIDSILQSLGLEKEGTATWKIPSFRLDLQRSIDLVEEVARVHGLDKVPSRQLGSFAEVSDVDRFYDFELGIKQLLVDRGFDEARTIKLISAKDLALVPDGGAESSAVLLKNPLSEDHTTLRPSVLPGLFQVLERNLRMGSQGVRLFETGTVFHRSSRDGEDATETQTLGIVMSGPAADASWKDKAPALHDIFDLRGVLERLPGFQSLQVKPTDLPHSLLGVELRRGKQVVGRMGQLHPAIARDLEAIHPVYFGEVDLAILQQASRKAARFEELPKFPGTTRDIAMEAPANLPNAKIEAAFKNLGQKLLVNYSIFDVFSDPSGEKLDADKKSIAYTLTYRDPKKTLESGEVDAIHSKVLDSLKAKLPISFR